MRPVKEPHQALLESLAAKGRLRALTSTRGVDFTSNDYLALAESDRLRQAAAEALARGVPLGAGGSRLLRGNHPEHEALEEESASFFGSVYPRVIFRILKNDPSTKGSVW